jgi:hypothetical protein
MQTSIVDIMTGQNVAYALWYNYNVVITKSQFDWASAKRKQYKEFRNA